MKTCAGIVLYNPDIQRLQENLKSILPQVDSVIMVDNGSKNTAEIDEFISLYKNSGVSLVRNIKNEGIAKALNQILDYALQNGVEWFLTLDQDTVSYLGLIDCYLKHIDRNVGQLSCNILDRNIGTIDKVKNYNGKETVAIDFCITSGCFNQALALKQVGGYRESLFIDGVDLDISCNLRAHGYKVLNVNFDGILHELGAGERKSVLGLKLVTAHHVPWRNYYARRNIIFVARQYYSGTKKWKMIIKQIVYGIGTVLLEDKKIERIKCNFKGIIDGFRI